MWHHNPPARRRREPLFSSFSTVCPQGFSTVCPQLIHNLFTSNNLNGSTHIFSPFKISCAPINKSQWFYSHLIFTFLSPPSPKRTFTFHSPFHFPFSPHPKRTFPFLSPFHFPFSPPIPNPPSNFHHPFSPSQTLINPPGFHFLPPTLPITSYFHFPPLTSKLYPLQSQNKYPLMCALTNFLPLPLPLPLIISKSLHSPYKPPGSHFHIPPPFNPHPINPPAPLIPPKSPLISPYPPPLILSSPPLSPHPVTYFPPSPLIPPHPPKSPYPLTSPPPHPPYHPPKTLAFSHTYPWLPFSPHPPIPPILSPKIPLYPSLAPFISNSPSNSHKPPWLPFSPYPTPPLTIPISPSPPYSQFFPSSHHPLIIKKNSIFFIFLLTPGRVFENILESEGIGPKRTATQRSNKMNHITTSQIISNLNSIPSPPQYTPTLSILTTQPQEVCYILHSCTEIYYPSSPPPILMAQPIHPMDIRTKTHPPILIHPIQF